MHNNINVTIILLQEEKDSVKIYLDLLTKSIDDFKSNHALSFLLVEKIRTFGWNDLDFTRDIEVKKVLSQISQVNPIICHYCYFVYKFLQF